MFNEKNTIEDDLIKQLQERGWKYVPGSKLPRDDYEEPLLTETLINKITEFNDDIVEEDIKKVLNELHLKSSGPAGSSDILDFIKSGVPVKLEEGGEVSYVMLFDYKNIQNNEFIVTNQAVYHRADKHIRPDIVLYINGIPLVVIECKNPVSFSSNWYDAYIQIKGYEKDIPELFKYVQIGVAAESVVKYFPIIPWSEEVAQYEWKESGKDSYDSIVGMLSTGTLLDIIKNFIFYRTKAGETGKIVARYMQYRAANKIVERVTKYKKGESDKTNGLIWHWQGSGKTLTMIFAGYKLYYSKLMENPSVFYVVDRIGLEEQLKEELNALKLSYDVIDSVRDMKKTITHDGLQGRRGMLVTLIHKFAPNELNELGKEIKELSKEKKTLRTRENVVAFIDESHRTQYGSLSAQMNTFLGNAFTFAFTGTPIAKKGRDTYHEFSYPSENEDYLDKYFITDSIKDGFTKKISHRPRLEKEVHLDKNNLENFINSEFEDISEIDRKGVEKKITEKLNKSRVVLENPKMIKKIAADIKEHFTENIEGKFKAMVVAVSRKACIEFKKELNKHLPPEYCEVVMTLGRNEKDKELREYYREVTKRFNEGDAGKINKRIIEDFKEEDNPKIFIVVDMLLTGFDAPQLQTIYLYKLLKEHRLLQAIARTNRPYKDIKEAGVIIDYVGILGQFKKAFKMYSKEDIKGALYDTDDIKEEFVELTEKLLDMFKDISKEKYDRKTILKTVEVLTTGKETGRQFIEDYKNLRRLFELLGPDEIKADYFNEFKWLSAVYTYYSKQVLEKRDDSRIYFKKYFKKTLEYIYDSTEIVDLEKSLPSLDFDEKYIEKLKKESESTEEEASQLVFTLNKYVLVEKRKDPAFISIAERVERIMAEWQKKDKDYGLIAKMGRSTLDRVNKLHSRQKKLAFTNMEYAVLLTMEKYVPNQVSLNDDVKELLERLKDNIYPGWILQQTARKKIEKEIRIFLRQNLKNYKITYEEMDNLCTDIKEVVIEYADAA